MHGDSLNGRSQNNIISFVFRGAEQAMTQQPLVFETNIDRSSCYVESGNLHRYAVVKLSCITESILLRHHSEPIRSRRSRL